MKKFNTAIVGATGAVGQEFLKLIEERNFPFGELKMLASSRSAGKKINFMGKEYTVEETTEKSFDGIKFALFAGGAASKLFAPAAVKAGAVVIDNSSNFRMDPEVPLVVPEVNPQAIARQPELLNDNYGYGTQAALQFVADKKNRRVDLSSGIGRGARRHGRIKNAT